MDSLDANIMDKSMRSVFVGNIPYEATEEKLKDIFGEVGQVLSFKLVFDRETGKPKGYGFCEYRDQETALSAMRNLNGYEIGGRNLRVDNACTEKSRMEMQNLLNQPPIENPYGEPIQADKAPEAISKAVASLPPEQMFELMKQMKICIQNNPTEARNMLLQNPQLTYALLQAQVVMRIVDPITACGMLHSQNIQPNNLMPSDKPILGPVPINNFAPLAPSRTDFASHLAQSAALFVNDRGQDIDLRSLQDMRGSDPRLRAMGGGGGGDRNMGGNDRGIGLDRGMGAILDRGMGGGDRNMGSNDRGMGNNDRGMANNDRSIGNNDRGMGGGDQDMRSLPNPVPNPVPPPLVDNFARDPRGVVDPRGGYSDPRQQQRSDPRQKNIPVPVAAPVPAPVPVPQVRPLPVPAPQIPPTMPRIAPGMSPNIGPSGASDQEKAALIMQVLQLSDEQIAMLPPEQRNSILVLKEQIAKSTQR